MKILQRITAFFTALILLNCPAPAFSAETGNSEDTSFLSGEFVVPGWGLIVIAGCLIFLSGTVVYGGIRFRAPDPFRQAMQTAWKNAPC